MPSLEEALATRKSLKIVAKIKMTVLKLIHSCFLRLIELSRAQTILKHRGCLIAVIEFKVGQIFHKA